VRSRGKVRGDRDPRCVRLYIKGAVQRGAGSPCNRDRRSPRRPCVATSPTGRSTPSRGSSGPGFPARTGSSDSRGASPSSTVPNGRGRPSPIALPRVWIISERITSYPAGAFKAGSGTTAYAWIVWGKAAVFVARWLPLGGHQGAGRKSCSDRVLAPSTRRSLTQYRPELRKNRTYK
jgi:hypothetical protein